MFLFYKAAIYVFPCTLVLYNSIYRNVRTRFYFRVKYAELIKNVIHLAVSKSGYVGELSNFILGAVFTLTAGLIYQKHKTKKSAILGGVIGALIMAAVSYPSNLFVVYPFYYNFMPKEAVLGVYQALFKVNSIEMAILIYNVPFTFIKGLISVAISALIYKPLRPFLKGKTK